MAIRGEGAVRVGLEGTGYESGLIAGHARALPDTLARYMAAARRAGGGRRPARTGRRASMSGLNLADVRQWARAQGIEVKDLGRVPGELAPRFKAPPPNRLVSYGHQSHGGFTHMRIADVASSHTCAQACMQLTMAATVDSALSLGLTCDTFKSVVDNWVVKALLIDQSRQWTSSRKSLSNCMWHSHIYQFFGRVPAILCLFAVPQLTPRPDVAQVIPE